MNSINKLFALVDQGADINDIIKQLEIILVELAWWLDNRHNPDKQDLKPGIHYATYKQLITEYFERKGSLKISINPVLTEQSLAEQRNPTSVNQKINRALIESLHNKQVLLNTHSGLEILGRLEVGRAEYHNQGYMYLYLGNFSGREHCFKLDYRKPLQRAKIKSIIPVEGELQHYFKWL